MVVLLGAAVLGFGPVFGGSVYLVAGLGGVALGTAIAVLGARLRWGVLLTAAVVVLGYFVFGGALALRETTVAGVIPSLETLRQLLLGAVVSWKQLLTVDAPVAGFDSLLVVPFLSALVTSVLTVALCLLPRRFGWALVPAAVLFIAAIAFGTFEAPAPVVRSAVFATVSLGWFAWRRTARRAVEVTASGDESNSDSSDARTRAQVRSRRMTAGASLLVGALVVGIVTGGVLAPENPRQVLRDTVVPPLDLHNYASPLVAYRKYVRDFREEALFTVEGLPNDARIRLATLDLYDGIVYNVAGDGSAGSGVFARVGSSIAEQTAGTDATVSFTIAGLTGVWVPDVGYLRSLSFTGTRAAPLAEGLHYNKNTGVAVATGGLVEGDTYTVDVVVPPAFSAEQLSQRALSAISMPPASGVPDAIAGFAASAAGDAATPLDQMLAMTAALREEGFFSHGLADEAPSRAGHGGERIAALLAADQMVGDDEQYAVTLALMAAQLGIPARVVMGFYPEAAAASGSALTVTGSDLHAWVEVPFDGAGWVSFDPTPPEDQIPQVEEPKPKAQPQSQVLQPPPPPQEPVALPADTPPDQENQDEDAESASGLWRVLGIVGGGLGLVVVLLGPPLIIGVLKARRKARRATAGRTVDRVSGGWDEVLDTASDLGTTIPRGSTRAEDAQQLMRAFPGSSVSALAVRADTEVFGPGDPPDHNVIAFWNDVEGVQAQMIAGSTRRARLRARLSVRSLRRDRRPKKTRAQGGTS